jgi:RNA polymerase sigma factor (sigma-70 family)
MQASTSPPDLGIEADNQLLGAMQTHLATLGRKRAPDAASTQACNHFYHRFTRVMHRVAATHGVRPDERDDVVQEAWSRILPKIPVFVSKPRRGGLHAWVRTVVRNVVFNLVRHRRRHPVTRLDAAPESGKEIAGPHENPLLRCMKHEDRTIVYAALERLEAEVSILNALIFHLRTLEEMDVGEVAEVLSLTPAQVRDRECRMFRRFQRLILQSERK